MEQTLEKCEGYLKLRKLADENIEHGWEDYRVNPKFDWVIERAKHYSDKLSVPINDILNSWVDGCDYSFMNYFQDANQPEINADKVRVFETIEDMLQAIGDKEFRCPSCDGVSTNPYSCNSGEEMSEGKICDWKVYGLFGDLGKGVHVYIKNKLKGEDIFMPLSWED
ncbi:hypothetical protein [Oceanobacillus indicireducens]|uniref:Uncharacterized protein n=1 Tax=Oceanobacillus indicireducens TaxID=1004261 RepID=A0A918D0T8_9BACI|nr:hypothetical protein [Oceanobacillus indicireducens]GGN54943.1 hypothetical protein GCM10007971_13240 [Oceanobacillus indicireducens]